MTSLFRKVLAVPSGQAPRLDLVQERGSYQRHIYHHWSKKSVSAFHDFLGNIPLEKIPLGKFPLEKYPLEKFPLEKIFLEKISLEKIPLKRFPWKSFPWKILMHFVRRSKQSCGLPKLRNKERS